MATGVRLWQLLAWCFALRAVAGLRVDEDEVHAEGKPSAKLPGSGAAAPSKGRGSSNSSRSHDPFPVESLPPTLRLSHEGRKNGVGRTLQVALVLVDARTAQAKEVEAARARALEPSRKEIGDIYFKGAHSVADLVHRASAGQVHMQGSVYGWYRDSSNGELSADFMLKAKDKYILLARKQNLNFEAYDVIVLVGLCDTGTVQTGFWNYEGIVDPSCTGSFSDCAVRTGVNLDVMINAPLYMKVHAGKVPSTIWANSMLKSLGAKTNDGALLCAKGAIAVSDCEEKQRANPFTVTGTGKLGLLPSCEILEELGWLPPEKMASFSRDDLASTRVVHLAPAGHPEMVVANTVQCVKVELPTTLKAGSGEAYDHMWLSFRADVRGSDGSKTDGVMLTLGSKNAKTALLLRAHDGHEASDDAIGLLRAGESLECGLIGLAVKFKQTTQSQATLDIALHDGEECPFVASTGTTAHSSKGAQSGGASHKETPPVAKQVVEEKHQQGKHQNASVSRID
eukprot:TRINITY_DN122244_c0_g1_i1.p1 TRINITY_DN122244_c0_g1~~TRINITY_DN122244_c0_g1_i1.p1  ORF type:complete len:511 (+),score=89.48 TRINITY_DN122244_c0_g1_i1:101-1633(+)